MKKVFFTVLSVALLGSASVFSQGVFGLKGGLNIASITNGENSSSLVRPMVGGFARFDVSDKFSFQPEFLLSFQGTKEEGELPIIGDSEVKTKLTYLNIPLMGRLMLVEGLSLEVGPQVGIFLGGELSIEPKSGGELSEDLTSDDVNTVDFGLNIGLAYELPSGLGFNARYNMGLTDLPKENPTDDKFQNSVFQVGLSYLLNKK